MIRIFIHGGRLCRGEPNLRYPGCIDGEDMNWIVYALAILAGLVVLVIFALQVFHSIAEYHERAGKQGARERLPLSKKPAASEGSNGTDRGAGETKTKVPMERSFTGGFTSQTRY